MGECLSSHQEGNGANQVPKKDSAAHHVSEVLSENSKFGGDLDPKKDTVVRKDGQTAHIAAQKFMFCELAASTKNFHQDYFMGEGGFGCVYKGRLASTGQVVSVEQLHRKGYGGNIEFLVDRLSLFRHANLENLIGYCADGDKGLLVHEFMPLGSLEDHLHYLPPDKEPLDWNTRINIAAGVAKGLEYLHNTANPPVSYRVLKSSNILLDEGYHPKLSNFPLARPGPVDAINPAWVMITHGYCAPEGALTLESDAYSFGVVSLELITGRKAIDNTRAPGEDFLVAWAYPLLKNRRKFPKLADPLLQGRYALKRLYQALAVAAMCLEVQAAARPDIGSVVTALTYLASKTNDPAPQQTQVTEESTPALPDDGGPGSPGGVGSPRLK